MSSFREPRLLVGKLIWPAVLLLFASACAATGEMGKAMLTPEEIEQLEADLGHIEGELTVESEEAQSRKLKVSEAKLELEKVREEKQALTEDYNQLNSKLEETENLIKELARKLGPPTAEKELAARKLLLVAKHFQRQNPTEARSVVAAKYKEVFEKHPGTKAAKEARRIYRKFMK